MSKFKVGDKARIIVYGGFSTANDFLGKEGTITLIYSNGNCELKTDGGLRYGPLGDLEPIPAEVPKDPFAPGEYVTCVEKHTGSSTYSKISETYLVDEFKHHNDGWFCALGNSDFSSEIEPLGHKKKDFRPATPEEIAAYKAKYETEPEPICASDADLSITAPECSFGEEPIPTQPIVTHNSLAGSAVTFDGKTYILRNPSTRPTIEIAGVVYELENV